MVDQNNEKMQHRHITSDNEPLRRYGHSKLFNMAVAAILDLFES